MRTNCPLKKLSPTSCSLGELVVSRVKPETLEKPRSRTVALTGVAAQVTLGANNAVQSVAVGVTGVSNTAYRASMTERALQGQAATAETVAQAAERATEGVEALSDIHASAEYRLHLTRVYTRRALQRAIERAQA